MITVLFCRHSCQITGGSIYYSKDPALGDRLLVSPRAVTSPFQTSVSIIWKAGEATQLMTSISQDWSED